MSGHDPIHKQPVNSNDPVNYSENLLMNSAKMLITRAICLLGVKQDDCNNPSPGSGMYRDHSQYLIADTHFLFAKRFPTLNFINGL